jgi:hypothetical protein
LATPLYTRFGSVLANWEFKQHLQEYTKIVNDIQTDVIPSDVAFREIAPKQMPSNVKEIMALRHPDGAVILVFLVGTGFPLHHTGYIYKGCAENTNCLIQFSSLEKKWGLRHVVENWYYFSD